VLGVSGVGFRAHVGHGGDAVAAQKFKKAFGRVVGMADGVNE